MEPVLPAWEAPAAEGEAGGVGFVMECLGVCGIPGDADARRRREGWRQRRGVSLLALQGRTPDGWGMAVRLEAIQPCCSQRISASLKPAARRAASFSGGFGRGAS